LEFLIDSAGFCSTLIIEGTNSEYFQVIEKLEGYKAFKGYIGGLLVAIKMRFRSEKNGERLILTTALILFFIVALFVNRNYISPDGRSFQRLGVNLAEGNGYSSSIYPPYERHFFREPGYPFVVSIACSINKFLGNNNNPLPIEDLTPGYYDSSHTELLILRILQAILAAITVLFFYKTLRFFLRSELAGIISFLFILYLPFSIYITIPQREILVTTLLTVMGYCFLKSATTKRTLWFDVTFGLLSAFLILTFQAYVFLLPLFLLTHLSITKSISKSIRSVSVIIIIIVFGVAPWSYRGYLESKNLKAIKTFGVSYTYEFKRFHDVNAKAFYLDLNERGEDYLVQIIEGYGESGKTMFEKSFNGYYLNYADSLQGIMNSINGTKETTKIVQKIRALIVTNFRKALVWPIWKPDYRVDISTSLKGDGRMSMIFSMSIGLVVAIMAILGMCFFLRKTWIYLPVFVFHLLMIPFIATEGRRVLPYLPFYFMFAILGVLVIAHIIKTRKLESEFRERFLSKL
jgi:hypothetical protein